MKKKLVSLFLVLALCLACVPVTALANDDHHGHDGWTKLTVSTIPEDGTLPPGSYYLSEAVTYTGSNSIMITGTVTLCLNGHVLNLGDKNITIDNGGALTLCDCTSDTTQGYLDSDDGLWHAGSSTDGTRSQCNLTGGVITGGRGYATKSYTFGGGVYVKNGTFTMEGGNIAGNTSAQGDGGGVYVSTKNNFTMNGGTITGNSARDNGGGVCSYGDFIMNDGSIADNTANWGGGVSLLDEGCITMNGGSITGNHANDGGGLYIIFNASFTMNGGTITGNSAEDDGGGVYVNSYSDFIMNGGSITGNHANDGGLYVGSNCRFTISGSPVIQNNTKPDGVHCNVYLKESRHITIGGKLTNAQIGVTMERPGSFTSGWDTYMQGQNPAEYFTVDDSAYGIGLDADGEAVLGQKCTVPLDTNGGALPGGDSPFKSVVGAALPTPTKTGYTFTGWYTTSDCSSEPVNEIPTPSSGITLYAGWRANTYTVTFKANGGNGAMANQSFTYDTPQTLTANAFSCLGKTFAGWNTKADGTGTTYTDGQQISNLTADSNGVVTLYAQWTANSYQVTLNTNGGTIADGKGVTSYTYGVGATLPTEITRSNYSFQGWYEDAGFTGEPVTEITGTDTGDKTYYAKWQYDPPYIPPTKTPSQQALDKIESAKDGDTVEITLSTGNTKLDKEVFEELAGQDITLVVKLSGGVSWTVNGRDIPENVNLTDIDMGVSMNTSSIPVDLINMVTGEMGTVQMTLAHDGEFGFTMTLTAPLGVENKGLWANLYHYNTTQKQMLFETAAQVDASGNVALKLSHASEYAIVLDEKSHELPFTDTIKGAWYQGAVEYVYRNSIMTGTSATTFEPGTTLSRAMVAQILYNLEGQPDISEENLGYPYEDVDAEAWYGDAVYWARINGVATGYEDNTFRPDKAVTREELAQMLYNYAQYKEIILPALGDLSKFPDGDKVSSWAKTAMSWATGLGVINGYEDNTLRPGGNTTRAEAASMILGMATILMK